MKVYIAVEEIAFGESTILGVASTLDVAKRIAEKTAGQPWAWRQMTSTKWGTPWGDGWYAVYEELVEEPK